MNMQKLEIRIQQECYTWFWNTYPELRGLLFRIENERKRGRIRQNEAKTTGTVAGVADMCFIEEGGRAIFFEIKRPGGKQSDKQQAWQGKAEKQGAAYYIIDNLEDFQKKIKSHIDILSSKNSISSKNQ